MPQLILNQAAEVAAFSPEDAVLRRLTALQSCMFFTLGHLDGAVTNGRQVLKRLAAKADQSSYTTQTVSTA